MEIAHQIMATEAKSAIDTEQDLETRAKQAFRAVKSHWMFPTDLDGQFLAACEGLYATCSAVDQERIRATLSFAKTLAAASSGVPVNVAAALDSFGDEVQPVPLQVWWNEVHE